MIDYVIRRPSSNHRVSSGQRSIAAGRSAEEFASDRRNPVSRHQLVTRIRAEFSELPGQCLTLPQAARLFAIPLDVCSRVFSVLTREGVLRQNADGRYTRPSSAR